jgi:protein O-GlcNAc transferase
MVLMSDPEYDTDKRKHNRCQSVCGLYPANFCRDRVVSRQTFAFLSAIGLTELAAKDAVDYIHIAQTLAAYRTKLIHLRSTLRNTLQASSLMDVAGFTRQLEATLSKLHHSIKVQEDARP